MPLIHVSAPQGALNKTDQDTLITQLSDAVLRSEGADPADPAALALVWAYYEESPLDAIYVGGKNLAKPPFTIAITTPEGALNGETRAALVKEIGKIVDAVVGPDEGRPNHWAMLTELDEGSWGAGGQIARLADIQSFMNIRPQEMPLLDEIAV